MNFLINYLLQFGQLNPQQIALIKDKASEVELRKGKYFSEAGKISKNVAFITAGILRVCYYSNQGEEITKYFVDENNFAVDLNSFTAKIPSSEYIQAVTDCSLIVFTTDALNELSNGIPQWDNIINQITAKSMVEKVNRISPMMAEDAKTRYLHFLEKFPQLANRIPLSYLASYLGITQSSLSRIRRAV